MNAKDTQLSSDEVPPASIFDFMDDIPLEEDTAVLIHTLIRRSPEELLGDARFERQEFESWMERYRLAVEREDKSNG